jgi:signal transduction histidine kinase
MTKGDNLKRTQTDIEALAKEAMSYADISKSYRLIINFNPKTFMLSLDKLLFRQVLFNLFLNSIQAMPQGGQIEMTINQRSTNGAKIIIADEGKGIKENRLKKVFDPLYTDKADGVGLGLSLCRDLISRHGGTISAKSKATKGTIIEIELPPV